MSEERRRYNAKQRIVESVVDGDAQQTVVPSSMTSTPGQVYQHERIQDPTLLAERERREHLYEQAEQMKHRDPEAAAFALAQLEALPPIGQESLEAPISPVVRRGRKPFDPMRLKAQLAKYYGWADESIGRLPLRWQLAYHREMVIQCEEEKQANEDAVKNNKRNRYGNNAYDGYGEEEVDIESVADSLPRPIIWPQAAQPRLVD